MSSEDCKILGPADENDRSPAGQGMMGEQLVDCRRTTGDEFWMASQQHDTVV